MVCLLSLDSYPPTTTPRLLSTNHNSSDSYQLIHQPQPPDSCPPIKPIPTLVYQSNPSRLLSIYHNPLDSYPLITTHQTLIHQPQLIRLLSAYPPIRTHQTLIHQSQSTRILSTNHNSLDTYLPITPHQTLIHH